MLIINTKLLYYYSIYFKIGYFKPIHTICFDFLRNIDKTSLVSLKDTIINFVLFSLIASASEEQRYKNSTELKVKNIIFSLPGFGGFGFLNSPPISTPYLPALDTTKHKYTLVLDLDETLVHYFYTPTGGTFLIRPYCFEFLKDMSELYEIVIFTAAMKDVRKLIYNILINYIL